MVPCSAVRCFAVGARLWVGACLMFGLAGMAAAQATTNGVAREAAVSGLIVKLKNAPAHEHLAALGAERQRSDEAGRLQRVLQMARMTEVRTRPAGRAAQHFDFGRRLSATEAQALAERLRSQPEVEWVEPNSREHLLAVVPNDTYYRFVSATDTGQWWLRPAGEVAGPLTASWGAPGVQDAWSLEVGRASAVVAVLDTGTTQHSDLAGHFLPGYDFVSEVEYANDGDGRDSVPADPGDWVTEAEANDTAGLFYGCTTLDPSTGKYRAQDSSWHGSIVSGIIVAGTNNRTGVAGINWNGRVLPVRVAGKCGATVLDITDAMRWAAGLHVSNVPDNPNPARVINISFGGSAACGSLYQNTIDELASIGAVVVAAAGNEQGAPTRPASCSGVVGVTALARDGLKAGYSNFGSSIVISTLGGDVDIDDGILTVDNAGTQSPATERYSNVFGTSFSAPIVSGVISLMLSANPNLSRAQIIAGLRATARPHVLSQTVAACSSSNSGGCVCTTTTCGAGILDAAEAVRYAAGAPPDVPASSGGGGALSWPWLVGLALGVWALPRSSRLARTHREGLAE